MNSFRDLSIKRKLTLIIMLTSSVALLLSCAALVTYDRLSSERALVRRINTMAEIIGFNCTAAISFDDPAAAAETLSALRVERHVAAAAIYDQHDRVFAIYHREDLPFTPPTRQADGNHTADDHLVLFRSIELEGRPLGAVYILADLQEMQDRLERYAGIVALSVLLASLVAFLIGSRLRDLIATPILDLAEKMRIVSDQKNYAVRADVSSADELGDLIDGFNAMLSQIQDRDAALQQAHDELERRAQELQIELAERRRIEAQITASLREKEVLLKEIHHRVKNNLQVISSLLDLQASNIEDSRTVDMFRDSQNRVNSMGLIHERLYQASDLARIDFAEYIQDLANNLFYSYAGNSESIELRIQVESIYLDVDTGIPCGLIINELVSNCLKYAFPEGSSGTIDIALRHEGDDMILSVCDDGVGLPPGMDYRKTSSLGLKLVSTLTRQLKGKIEVSSQNGSQFIIQFPV